MRPRQWCYWQMLATRAAGRLALGENTAHGPGHWRRVERNGLWICSQTRADPAVVRLFAWLHDCCRQNENHDPGHGRRAAEFAEEIRGKLFGLPDAQFGLLLEALRGHADGRLSDDPTIGACWDADRLDLGRVGISPDPEMMCTGPGRAAAAGEIEIPDEPPDLPGHRGARMGGRIADAPDRERGQMEGLQVLYHFDPRRGKGPRVEVYEMTLMQPTPWDGVKPGWPKIPVTSGDCATPFPELKMSCPSTKTESPARENHP